MSPLSDFDLNILAALEKAQETITVGPKSFIDKAEQKGVSIPALNLYKFNDAVVNAKSSAIYVRDSLVFESYNDEEYFYVQGLVGWHDKKFAVVKMYKEEKIEDGFFLAGLGCANWYHWLIEILPKALFLKELPKGATILVSEFLSKYPSMVESLKAVIGESYDLVFMDSNKNYKVKNLTYINSISYVPFNLSGNRQLVLGDVFMRGNELIEMRNRIVKNVSPTNLHENSKRLFLTRKGHRVPENQRELSIALSKHEFQDVSLDNLTLGEQINLFSNAEYIIGVSGAAFTNIIFSTNEAKWLCLMPKTYNEFSCYSNLANIFDVDLTYVFYELEDGENHYSNKYMVDIDQVLKLVELKIN